MRNPILGPTCEMPVKNFKLKGLLAEALNLLIQDNDPARQLTGSWAESKRKVPSPADWRKK